MTEQPAGGAHYQIFVTALGLLPPFPAQHQEYSTAVTVATDLLSHPAVLSAQIFEVRAVPLTILTRTGDGRVQSVSMQLAREGREPS